MDPRLIAFVGVAALLTISPGPDMAVMFRSALSSGRSAVVPTALGTCTGLGAWALASSIGIAALVAASAQAFDTLRLVGALYLILLGAMTLRDAVRRTTDGPETADTATSARASRWASFRRGLLTNLLNPKVGVFYTTFLPQFIAPGQPVLARSLLLAAIHASMCLVWLVAYGYGASRLATILRRNRVRQAIEAATGTVLVGFGIRLATDRG
jgi:threonine/homoserine/homoserine lactone efflux protein